MKFIVLALAALSSYAAAGTVGDKWAKECTPATYQCLDGWEAGWQVCDASGKWTFAGHCPPQTVCKFFEPSKSPYCVPPGYEFPQ